MQDTPQDVPNELQEDLELNDIFHLVLWQRYQGRQLLL